MQPLVRRLLSTWDRRDLAEIGVLLGVIALMHVVGFAVLVFAIAPEANRLGPLAIGHQLARGVVDGGDVVRVERVP